jgi:hypothetical protein
MFIVYQIGIGIIVDILIFIPSLILVEFFRRVQEKPSTHQVSPLQLALFQLRPTQMTNGTYLRYFLLHRPTTMIQDSTEAGTTMDITSVSINETR